MGFLVKNNLKGSIKMKVTETLQALINLSAETKPYESVHYFRKPRDLYYRMFEILQKTDNENRRQLVNSLDDMVGIMVGNSFDDGVVTGIKLASTMKEILNNAETTYLDILNNSQYPESIMKKAREVIHKFE